MILRVIDKETQLFLRDDFTFDEETEIGLDVEPAQGLYAPKWDGEKWIETGQAPESLPHEPTELELIMLAISELGAQRELDRTENQVAIAELAESLIGVLNGEFICKPDKKGLRTLEQVPITWRADVEKALEEE